MCFPHSKYFSQFCNNAFDSDLLRRELNILFHETMVQMYTAKITRTLNVGFEKVWFDLSLSNQYTKSRNYPPTHMESEKTCGNRFH